MSTPILATKLYLPPPRPNVVLRPRLIERLNEGLQRKLTLIAAPAGFGKTTLLAAWLAERQKVKGQRQKDDHDALLPSAFCLLPSRVAWLSLDAGDSELTRFLTYLVAALQTVAPSIGAGLLSALQSPQPPLAEAILTALLNEIAAIPDKFVLVLDDYHVIDSTLVDQALTFLLDHLPPQLHLVITTREDPQLPLARLRVRDQMTELRAADLRFTAAEAAAFLSQVMGLDLTAEQVSALETRTEGWIAGLQLAALSMRGRTDVSQFVKAFAGDNRYIVDYLVEEVLQRQPEHVRSFLLQTAILDRLSGPLCDAVTGQEQGSARLEALERGNFFVVPLDDTRRWYRYHHLFADVLSTHLLAEQPDQVATLHRRASDWYEQNGLHADAIRHALAAADFARAADLVKLAVPEMRRSRQEATILGWLKALPDELISIRPVLSVGYAGALLSGGQLAGVEHRLRDAERWLETTAHMQARSAEMVVVDKAEFRHLPGLIAVYRAGQALAVGDLTATVTYARLALNLILEEDHLGRGAATALLGLAYWTSGDLDAAQRSYADGMAHLQRAGYISDTIGGAIALADIGIAQGRLRETMRIYERGLRLAVEQGEPLLRGTADMYVGMSELQREQNDLPAATQLLLHSKQQGEHTGFPQHRYRWRVAMARILEAQGDLDGALDLLQEAERWYVSDFLPNVRPVAALKTRVWLAQGRLGAARRWARDQGLSAQDDLSYLHEFEHITLARLLLARATSEHADESMLDTNPPYVTAKSAKSAKQAVRPSRSLRSLRLVSGLSADWYAAIGLLERLLQAAEAGQRTGSVIEILILQALALQIQGDIPAALVPLSRALTLAEPEGYVRLFVDASAPMAALLQEALACGILPSYVEKLLAAFPDDDRLKAAHAQTVTVSPRHPITPALVEPLSERELDVLRLLRTDLNGPEIARELIVSLSTIRTHTRNIYDKLGVTSRRAAVRRAEELDLF